ncbi:BrnA antitoxin family protein [Enterovirga aerilata]|uniref:BrnA antitoxin family protein n=1 Tax=Enterovirga aerilata TaxID=2730920 RepID=A0A849I3X9_9HYPH|nr:BrnA antitoxin family protein [Enterovirga sp. DB1703]NNM72068.1 hypothetical protein [Enterovirga sp. DB1703]
MADRTRRGGGDSREAAERAFRAATTRPAEVARPTQVAVPRAREMVSIRLDRDVLEHFQADGPGWQERINDALRKAAGL